jgi:hypothetical protein
MKNPVLWFRITAVLMLLFAIGHTLGFLAFRPSAAEGQAVWASMNNVHITEHGSIFTYGGFYRGFGLSLSAFQLFFAWLAWILASMARQRAPGIRAIAWGMFAVMLAEIVLSLRYFSVEPAIFSVISALCFAMAAISVPSTETARAQNA